MKPLWDGMSLVIIKSFDVFCSWASDGSRVELHRQYFESIWNGYEPGVQAISFPKVAKDKLIEICQPGWS